ncbi:CPBP family intramembrane glutamic endopeptidase [uncultured Corynebacterium sp.]|uniref:CPBP family intramembrane glutamic endopeptidase n=1 Tax=uncultured Corynebacterium sp. TaxID=159447 RepID=UPI0025D52104|nr:CPBP family intramembrane glutamic endopeptidase [uncultured Corynebacterium sp.]
MTEASSRDQRRPATTRRLRAEIVIVLLVTFGTSALNAVVRLIGALAEGPLQDQPVSLNDALADDPWLNGALQLIRIAGLLAWGGLAWYLLRADGIRGMPGRLRGGDWAWGAGLAALIGLPGLGLYVIGIVAGFGRPIDPAAMGVTALTIVPLLGWAAANAVAEELVVVGWLVVRLRQLRAGSLDDAPVAPGATPTPEAGDRMSARTIAVIIAASALLRGAYHLYQGVGAGFGNIVMGVVFAAWFLRTGRVWPLVIAHFLIDAVAFTGYPLVAPWLESLV